MDTEANGRAALWVEMKIEGRGNRILQCLDNVLEIDFYNVIQFQSHGVFQTFIMSFSAKGTSVRFGRGLTKGSQSSYADRLYWVLKS